jgi:uncharacterized lipoprotein YddW (UPF0748 family)
MRRNIESFNKLFSTVIVILLVASFQPSIGQAGALEEDENGNEAISDTARDTKTNLKEVQPVDSAGNVTANAEPSKMQTAAEPVASQPATEPGKDVPSEEKRPAEPVKTAVGEDEVLNNILGVPQEEQPAQAAPASPPVERKKPFSFLDPEASSVLAPEFDYGVYSMSMRILEDYKKRILDALEAARELSLNIPLAQVDELLKEADAHKKNFGDLYLNNQTQAGLDEYAQARKRLLQALALTTTSPRVEGRAIWLDRGTIIKAGSPIGMKMLMQRLHQAGINVVYFEALNAGFPMYQSSLLRPNPMVEGWDPLQAAVEEGHRLGMEVHAWVWVFAVGNRRHNDLIGKPDAYAGPILEDLGLMSEALRGRDGSLNTDSRQKEFWLSPASPKGREFLLSVYREILTRYPVDGLHLDYIRYPFQASGTRMGFEAVSKERFTQSTGMSLDNPDDYTLRMWIAWKTHQVSSFVQQVSEMARSVRPELKISAAVFPMKREARIVAIQQDWETWVDNGWIDVLNPMSYTSDPKKLQAIYEQVCRSPQKHVLVYPGISLKYLDGGSLVSHLEALRKKGSMGSTLFAGAYLDGEKIDILGRGPFKESNSLPPHRNVVQSIKLLMADYEQKMVHLQANGSLDPQRASDLRSMLLQLSAALDALQGGVDANKLQQIQQAFQVLQASTQSWAAEQKAAYPSCAAYFDALSSQISSLVGYLVDQSTPPTTAEAFSAFKKPAQASVQPKPVSAATIAPSKPLDTTEPMEPPAQDTPAHAEPLSESAP